jgi:signal transduction histidine kinase
VVERHGRSIDFETQSGQGTTFHVRLPVAERVSAVNEVAA